MVIIVNRRRNPCIIISPLASIYPSVSIPVVEISQELLKYLIFSHFPFLNFRVHRSIINTSQITGFHKPIPITVKLKKSFINHRLTSLIRSASHTNKKLVEIYASVLIKVEITEKFRKFIVSQLNSSFSKTYSKLVPVNFFVTVVTVH